MQNYDLTAFEKGLDKWNIQLTDKQKNQFLDYYEILTEWNTFMNLTAITEFQEVVTKHFLDSLSCVKSIDMTKVKTMIDIGTGAGFPGVPLKIAFPHLQACLLDSLKKRVNFLEESFQLLGLTDITAIHGRAEDIAKMNNHRESYTYAISRAVANLSTLSELCIPFVKQDGIFISYKAEKGNEELQEAKNAINILGGLIDKQITYTLPDSDLSRNLILIKKIASTPKKYPRKAGTPAKEPL